MDFLKWIPVVVGLVITGCYDLEYRHLPPTVQITAPQDGDVLQSPVTLEASAIDPEEGDLSMGIVWVQVGVPGGQIGPSITVDLDPGQYTYTAQASDSAGQIGQASITFTVEGL